MARIVNTDNFGRDYPDEKFVTGLPYLRPEALKEVCEVINRNLPQDHDRYFKVVDDDYVLQPGFEP